MSTHSAPGRGNDLFPVYCRHCHKEISSRDRVCPHCGQPQGLVAQPSQPPAHQPSVPAPVPPQQPSGTVAQPAQPQQAGIFTNCPYCSAVITSGDYFCRACGRPLVPGVRSSGQDGAGLAYGLSALICALLGFAPGAVILGIIAMVKGARGLGCGAILLSLIVTGVVGMLALSSLRQFVPALPLPDPSGGLLP